MGLAAKAYDDARATRGLPRVDFPDKGKKPGRGSIGQEIAYKALKLRLEVHVSESPDYDLRQILWNQFGGALQMLENAVEACPAEVWGSDRHPRAFWYLAYHTLFWTDYYFSETTESDFRPPEPFTKGEFDEDVLPERVYTKAELLEYLDFVWDKSRTFIKSLTPEKAQERFVGEYRDFSLHELAIYNTRHVQHHAAQLNLLLRQRIDSAPEWASLPKRGLED